MKDPQGGLFRSISSGFGAVDFYPGPGEDGKPLTGIVTTVLAQRTPTSWLVIGVGTDTVRVDAPSRLQAVSSPVTVSGQALAYEGTVEVRVLQLAQGKVTDLGNGHVTGGGDVLRPFTGLVTFKQPSGSAGGWLVPAAPEVRTVQLTPELPILDGWLVLPAGSGKLTVTVNATVTSEVEVYLATAGAQSGSLGRLLGTGTRNGDTFTYTWRYPDEPVLGHLTVVATGPGGRTEYVFCEVYHN